MEIRWRVDACCLLRKVPRSSCTTLSLISHCLSHSHVATPRCLFCWPGTMEEVVNILGTIRSLCHSQGFWEVPFAFPSFPHLHSTKISQQHQVFRQDKWTFLCCDFLQVTYSIPCASSFPAVIPQPSRAGITVIHLPDTISFCCPYSQRAVTIIAANIYWSLLYTSRYTYCFIIFFSFSHQDSPRS